jgi:arylsulfatase A-like enzyme
VLERFATIGFVSLLALPVFLVLDVAVRAVWAAWAPAALLTSLTEDGGGAPRLAGWLLTAELATIFLGWASYHGTWLLTVWTQFKPVVVGLAEPIFTVAAAVGALALSRPAAHLIAALARGLDRRWRRRGHRTLLTPRKLVAALLVINAAGLWSAWRWVILPRVGTLDLAPAIAPLAGLGAMAWTHLAWRNPGGTRAVIAGVLGAALTAALTAAALARLTAPGVTLTIWGERPVAGLAIEWLFDTDAIRADLSLADIRPVARPGAPHHDLILITIDTTRADRTPPYGGPADMPTLRELGQRGAVFEWAFAPSNVTRRSIPSMVIGTAPNRVRGRVIGWALRVDPRHVFVAERLAAGGYDTAGFMCCSGFWAPENHTGLGRGLAHLEVETTNDGTKIAADAKAWLTRRLAGHPTRPLFVWMHLLEPHNWFIGQPEAHNDAERRTTYDRSLAAVDKMIAEVLAPYAAVPADQQPIVVVTADHGEGLGDHGAPFHSSDLYNSQLHVPLIIAGPGISPLRLNEVVSLTDLVPTLVELAGFEPPREPGLDGSSFAPLATGGRAARIDTGVAFAAMIKDRSNPGGVAAIVRGRWKLIEHGGVFELYDMLTDPDERFDLIAQKPTIVAELKLLLAARQAAAARSPFAP